MIFVVECGGVWWSVVECGGVWWSVVECCGVWWSKGAEGALINIHTVRVSEGEEINIHTMRRSEEDGGGVWWSERPHIICSSLNICMKSRGQVWTRSCETC